MDVIRKLNYIFNSKQKIELFWLFIIICIGSGLELLAVSVILPIIDGIMDPEAMLEQQIYIRIYSFFHMASIKPLIMLLLVSMIAIYFLKNIFLIYMYNRQYRFIFENQRKLADRMVQCYMSQPYIFHVSKSTAELLRNINEDSGNFFGALQAGIKLLTELMVCAALGVFLLIKDKTITISVVFLLGIMMCLSLKVYKKYLLKMGERNRYYEMSLNKWVQQAFGGIKEVKILNKEQFFYNKYDEAYRGHAKSEYTYHTLLMMPKPIIESLCICGLLGAIAIKFWWRGADITYFVPVLSVFAVAAFRLLPSFNRITEYLGTIMYYKAAITSIFEDLKEVDELNRVKTGKEKTVEGIAFRDKIEIRDLSFRYAGSDKYVLRHLDLCIARKSSIAFIGQSGAGKTTLADIIMGLLQPSEGGAYVDGADIFDNLEGWHRIIGYIPQNIYLMDDTIRNNIAFGVDEGEINEEMLSYAVEQAQLAQMIRELPSGLDTQIGEMGVRLSGGQRQRIGIARALYHNPEILVLDEATSALDNDTEKAVMDAIESLHGKMTLIIIAHRLSTIKDCDLVYEIGDGKAVQVKE
ncbi:protein glycosylation K [Lachnospiraceae bacterium]|nr:protein glycosylation K [Lachnospiraceae bacterium]